MCKMCEMKAELAAKMGIKIEKVEVGTASPEAVAYLNDMQQEVLQLKSDTEERADELLEAAAQAVKDQVYSEFEQRGDRLEADYMVAWKAVLASAGIAVYDSVGDYSVDPETGIITTEKVTPVDKAPTAAGVH